MTETVARHRAPRRTAAASTALRRRKAERLVDELGPRLYLLEDEWVLTLACVLLYEIAQRPSLGENDLQKKWTELNG